MTPVFGRGKKFRAFDRAATVIVQAEFITYKNVKTICLLNNSHMQMEAALCGLLYVLLNCFLNYGARIAQSA
jgi:hypothetical protein